MSEELARQESRARFAEYVLAVIGAWAISAAQYNSAPLVFTALAAAVAYIYLDVARLRPLPSAAVQAVCGIAFVWVLVAYSGSRTVFVLGHLLIGMQAARFFGPRRMTSGHEIYLLNVTLLVVAGVHDSGVGFLARLVAFVPAILWAAHERLLETEIRNRLPASEPGPSIGVVGRKEARTEGLKVVAAMTVVGLGLGLVLFFLTPVIAGAGGTAGGGDGDDGRGGRRGRGRPGAPAAVVGFSPQVTLYKVGRLKSDRSPALIVRLGRRGAMPRTAQGRMLMRGLTYMHYGAGSWAVPSSRGRMISAGGREVRLSRPGPDVPLALQTVTVKADFEGVVFAMRPLVSLKASPAMSGRRGRWR